MAGGVTGGEDAVRIDMGPLDSAAARELVEQVSDLRPAAASAVLARAEGNPYFLLELTEASSGTDEASELPESIEVLIAAQIDRLPRAERDLLRGAAVLGVRHPRALFEAVVGVAAPPSALTSFLGLEDEEVAFRRAVHRDVAYEQLTFAGRRHLHREAAQLLEQQTELAGPSRLPMLVAAPRRRRRRPCGVPLVGSRFGCGHGRLRL